MSQLSYNDFDLAAVTNFVSDAKRDGLKADYDLSKKENGVVSVVCENWKRRDGSYVIFEIHKIGKARLLGHRVSWIVQLYDRQTRESVPVKKGCVSGDKQVTAIHEASLDVKHDFLSVCDFELAYSAAME